MKAEKVRTWITAGRIAGKTSLSRKVPVHGPRRPQMFLDEAKGEGHSIDIFENE